MKQTITRTDLAATVNLIAASVNMTPPDRTKLTTAMLDPSLKEVATGAFTHKGATCPLTCAGLFPPGEYDAKQSERLDLFWSAFDDAMGLHGQRVIQVIG